VNENQAHGIGKTIKGAIKEATSKATDNKLGEVEGKVEKDIGKAQTKLGDKQQGREKESRPQK
jgi:uncharacterized protein YjbJ (UPF0337 family)